MGHGVDGRNIVGITPLGVKLHDVRLEILKVYMIYSYKFCVFDVTRLLNTQDEEDSLLIIIRPEKTLFYLNMIYSLPKHIYQWFRCNCYRLHRNSRLYL